jgi:hypothetical protein
MKKLNLLYLIISACLWAACSDEHDPVIQLTSAPVLENLAQNSYILSSEQADAEFATFKWSQARYNVSVALRNLLQIDKAGNNFASPATLVTTTDATASVLVKDINNTLNRLGLEPGVAADVEIRLVSYLGSRDNYEEISNVLSLNITPYVAGEISVPMLWTPGNQQGWNPAEAANIYSVNDDGVYTGYIYLDGEFKFTSQPDWDGANYGDGGSNAISTEGGNLTAEAGYYFATVNLNTLGFKLEKRSWGVLGDATPTGWDADTKLIYDPADKLLKLDITLGNGEIKFRANDSWDINLGIPTKGGGFDEPLVQGGENIPVTAGEYRIILDLSKPEYKAYLTNPGTTLPEPPITPPEEPDYPENLYMIGEFAGWNWEADNIVELIPVHGKAGHFWCISYFTAGSPFKWAPGKAWAGDFAKQDEAIGYQVVDGNAVLDADGLYMIYVDLESKKIVIEEALIYGIGDCFGSWDAKTYPFALEGATASISTTADGELRIYAESSIAVSDWWTREFVILDGKIVFRGKGGDQERVPVEAGKKISLDFSNGTGTIE